MPDGALARLNFETLPVPGDRRHYWIDDVQVAVRDKLLRARVVKPPFVRHGKVLIA